MKIFLTGTTGYVGNVIARKLLDKRYDVTGLVRTAEAAEAIKEKGITPVIGDLSTIDILKTAASEADAVIHTAFSHNVSDYNDAVKVDMDVVAAFAKALEQTNKPLIVTTSSAILGDTKGNLADEDYPLDPNSPRKLRGEGEYNAVRLSSRGIRSIVVRLPLFVYGLGGSLFLPFVINQAKGAGTANYVEPGDQKVAAVHVEDAADLYIAALETSTGKGLFNVSAESVSMRDMNEATGRMLGLPAKAISREKGKEQFGKMFDFLSINNEMSSAKAQERLGWAPRSGKTLIDDLENGSYRNF